MVKALVKKELKDSYKVFLPILVLMVIVTSVVNIHSIIQYQTYNPYGNESRYVIENMIFIITIVLAFSLFIVAFIGVVKYLYANVYNDKGFELFTLPVSSWEIIVSKTIVVLLWAALIFFAFIGLMIFYQLFMEGNWVLDSIQDRVEIVLKGERQFSYLRGYINKFLYILGIVITLLFAGALSHSKYVQKGRSVVAFAVVLLIAFIVLTFDVSIGGYANWVRMGQFEGHFYSTFSYLPTNFNINSVLIFRLGVITLLSFLTSYLWERKLQI